MALALIGLVAVALGAAPAAPTVTASTDPCGHWTAVVEPADREVTFSVDDRPVETFGPSGPRTFTGDAAPGDVVRFDVVGKNGTASAQVTVPALSVTLRPLVASSRLTTADAPVVDVHVTSSCPLPDDAALTARSGSDTIVGTLHDPEGTVTLPPQAVGPHTVDVAVTSGGKTLASETVVFDVVAARPRRHRAVRSAGSEGP